MHNLLQFINKYSNLLLFLVLEIVAFVLLFTQNGYQRNKYFASTSMVVGHIYEVSDAVWGYLHLRSENAELTAENARLKEALQVLENRLEPTVENAESLLYPDCATYQYSHKGLHYVPAKVIHAELNKQRNSLIINKGTRDGVEQGFGVVGPSGVVGIVSEANERFSLVFPLINTEMHTSCRLPGSQVGPLQWDGTHIGYAGLEGIARHAQVHVGDTLLTSGLTTAFPEGIMVGIVDEAELRESDAYYHIRVRLATDFSALGYVQVVCNEALKELQELEGY